MIRNEAQIKRTTRERFEIMALRLAHFLELSKAETFDKLPLHLREHFEDLEYCDLVVRLMKFDKRNGLSYQQIANKYGIPNSTVKRKLKK